MRRTCLLLSITIVVALIFVGCSDESSINDPTGLSGIVVPKVGSRYIYKRTRGSSVTEYTVKVAAQGTTVDGRPHLFRFDALQEGGGLIQYERNGDVEFQKSTSITVGTGFVPLPCRSRQMGLEKELGGWKSVSNFLGEEYLVFGDQSLTVQFVEVFQTGLPRTVYGFAPSLGYFVRIEIDAEGATPKSVLELQEVQEAK